MGVVIIFICVESLFVSFVFCIALFFLVFYTFLISVLEKIISFLVKVQNYLVFTLYWYLRGDFFFGQNNRGSSFGFYIQRRIRWLQGMFDYFFLSIKFSFELFVFIDILKGLGKRLMVRFFFGCCYFEWVLNLGNILGFRI